MANYCAEQSREDIQYLTDRFSLYRRIIHRLPAVFQFEKSAARVYEDIQSKTDKLEGCSLNDIAARKEIITHVTYAETDHFNRTKVVDFVYCMRHFLKNQAKFYAYISDCLNTALADFESIPLVE